MTRVVIAGSHGKTTTTAMVLHAMQYANRSTNYMVGAQLEGFDCMVDVKWFRIYGNGGRRVPEFTNRFKTKISSLSAEYRGHHRNCLGSYQCVSNI